jgi:hypothetical protein
MVGEVLCLLQSNNVTAKSGDAMNDRPSLRLSATLLLVGQLLFIVVTQFHADGPANDHPVVFAEYARSDTWKVVHVGQFAAMAILLAGLIVLFFALDARTGIAKWSARFGVASAVAAFALYAVLQAVDGVALKQAVDAWVSAPDAEKAARFANAETMRWLEWAVRSYQNFALGLALLLFGSAVVRTASTPRAIGYLIGLSGLVYLAQGWVGETEGFSQTHTMAIVLAFVLDLAWMIWLLIVAIRMPDSERAISPS